jgi:preprotein translocase subunit YajC
MINMINFLLFSQQQPTDGQPGSAWIQMLPILAIIVVFYFFFIRPQMKKSKEQKKYREALKKGDKIITIGGIHGKIIEVQDTTFTIEVEGQMKLRIERSAVAMDAASQIGAKQ